MEQYVQYTIIQLLKKTALDPVTFSENNISTKIHGENHMKKWNEMIFSGKHFYYISLGTSGDRTKCKINKLINNNKYY